MTIKEHLYDVRVITEISDVRYMGNLGYGFVVHEIGGMATVARYWPSEDEARLKRFALYNLWKGWEAAREGKEYY